MNTLKTVTKVFLILSIVSLGFGIVGVSCWGIACFMIAGNEQLLADFISRAQITGTVEEIRLILAVMGTVFLVSDVSLIAGIVIDAISLRKLPDANKHLQLLPLAILAIIFSSAISGVLMLILTIITEDKPAETY